MEDALSRRASSDGTTVFEDVEPHGLLPGRGLNTRATERSRKSSFCNNQQMKVPPFENCSTLLNVVPNVEVYGYHSSDCNDFGFGTIAFPDPMTLSRGFATDHILELQVVSDFLTRLSEDLGPTINNPNPRRTRATGMVDLCNVYRNLWNSLSGHLLPEIDGVKRQPIDHIMAVMPSNDNTHTGEFVLLDNGVNTAKKGVRYTLRL